MDHPLDEIAETGNDQTAEVLELLGHETRLEIIVALWGAIDRTPDPAEQDQTGLSFSELYDRVGVDDSGHFNYHLDKLTGTFVEEADGTYTLTRSAWGILSAIIKGTVTEPPSFTDEPADGVCPQCGESIVIDYEDRSLSIRCTNCEGNFQRPDCPPGLLLFGNRAPVGLVNRTPQEFFRQANVTWRHNLFSYFEGVCPTCTGTVTVEASICESHESENNSLCPQCGLAQKIRWHVVCDVCKRSSRTPGMVPIWGETAVLSFCYERGLDANAAMDRYERKQMFDATDLTVSARDPVEVTATVELEGDRLTATLDEDANVVDIKQTTGVP